MSTEQLKDAVVSGEEETMKESIRAVVREEVERSVNGEEQIDESTYPSDVKRIVERELSDFDSDQINESLKGTLAKMGASITGVLGSLGLGAGGALTFIGGALGGAGLAVGAAGIAAAGAALFGGLWAGEKLKGMIDFKEFEKLQGKIAQLMSTRDSMIKKGIEEGDPSQYKSDVKKVTKQMQSAGKQMRKFYSDHQDMIQQKLTRKEVGNLEDVIEAAEKGRLTGIEDISQKSIA